MARDIKRTRKSTRTRKKRSPDRTPMKKGLRKNDFLGR